MFVLVEQSTYALMLYAARDYLRVRMGDRGRMCCWQRWPPEMSAELWHAAPDDDDLRRIAVACGGWWIWPEALDAAVFVPMDEWLALAAKKA